MTGRSALKWALGIAVSIIACLIIWLGVHYVAPVQVKQYNFDGKVVAVHPDTSMVRVHNENMPGLMAPMDMDYQLKDPVVSSLKPGDTIHATLLSDGRGLFQLRNVTIKTSP